MKRTLRRRTRIHVEDCRQTRTLAGFDSSLNRGEPGIAAPMAMGRRSGPTGVGAEARPLRPPTQRRCAGRRGALAQRRRCHRRLCRQVAAYTSGVDGAMPPTEVPVTSNAPGHEAALRPTRRSQPRGWNVNPNLSTIATSLSKPRPESLARKSISASMGPGPCVR